MATNPHDLTRLPPNLPVPQDDGACDHLPGRPPSGGLAPIDGGPPCRVGGIARGHGHLLLSPDRPGGEPRPGGVGRDSGARGCTPQACAFRDHHEEFLRLGVRVFGLSAQTPEDQREAAERLHLPMELLSDAGLTFAHSLALPTFEFEGAVLIKRLTIVARNGQIVKVFYPVFPPDANAQEVLTWLRAHPQGSGNSRS